MPVFHQALWEQAYDTRTNTGTATITPTAAPTAAHAELAVLNLGGIANLSILQAGHGAQGFDCGPANALLDADSTLNITPAVLAKVNELYAADKKAAKK